MKLGPFYVCLFAGLLLVLAILPGYLSKSHAESLGYEPEMKLVRQTDDFRLYTIGGPPLRTVYIVIDKAGRAIQLQ